MFGRLRNMWIVGVYALLTIVAPWATLFAVYGFDDGWALIGFYSHLFWFPLLFGVAQVVFLLRLVRILARLPVKKLLWRVGLPFSILVVLAGAYIEGAERPALFELKRSCIREVIPSTNQTFIEHLKNPEPQNRAAFEQNLPKNSWQIPMSDRSVTEVVCGLSILLQIFIWVWTALAFCWAARLLAPGNPRYREQRKVFIPTMLWTLILSLPWFAMRKAFENYRGQVYPNLEVPNAVLLLGVLFLLGSIFMAAVTWQVIGERLNSAIGLVSALGISGLFIKDSFLEAVFPPTPSVSHFLLIVLIVSFILTILLVRMPSE